jgi:hypothetical protein
MMTRGRLNGQWSLRPTWAMMREKIARSGVGSFSVRSRPTRTDRHRADAGPVPVAAPPDQGAGARE